MRTPGDSSHPPPGDRRSDVLGAVLAGGASRRMGRDKALLSPDGGPPLAERVAQRLESVVREVVMVVGEPADGRFPDRRRVPDRDPGRGPLGGLDAALAAADGRPVLLAACDLPNLTPAILREVLGDEKIALAMAKSSVPVARIAATDDRVQPLLGLYGPACQAPVALALRSGRLAMHRLLEDLEVIPVALPADALINLNRPEDLASLDAAKETR